MLSRYSVIRPLSPFRGIPSSHLQSTMNRLFADFETAFARPVQGPAVRRPEVQLRDGGEAIHLLADVPGLALEDIDLAVEGETLTLKTTPKPAPVPEGFELLRRERRAAAIEASFVLPYAIDAASASARLEQGRLSVTLPKATAAKPHRIAVKAG